MKNNIKEISLRMNILVADDDQNVREVVVELLTSLGHSVVAVKNAEDALDYLKSNKPHLVFTDVNMGAGMDGYQLFNEIKKIHIDLHVVIMTAYGTITSAVESIKNGVFEYLPKPFNLSDLERILLSVAKSIFSNPFSLETVEKNHIESVLSKVKTYEEAAELLGINMSTLWRKRKTYGVAA
jgi:DNA-binding NtrC family response regulator